MGAGDPAGQRRVLVLCTGNSCRSQMAEAWVNQVLGERWQACSAGTSPAESVHPLAVRVMAEVGIDLSGHAPQHVDRYVGDPWDMVVTVCDSARETCPFFPGRVHRRHISFPDPALAQGSERERLDTFRRVRDDIRARLLPALEQHDKESRAR